MATEERRRLINGQMVAKRLTGQTEGNGWMFEETDWDALFNAGRIKVSDPEHRRIIEDLDRDGDDRIIFIGAAADMEVSGDE